MTNNAQDPTTQQLPCGCPVTVVTSLFPGGEQCSGCGTPWDREDKITRQGAHNATRVAATN